MTEPDDTVRRPSSGDPIRLTGGLDRSAQLRLRPGLVDSLLADPGTLVVRLRGAEVPARQDARGPWLDVIPGGDVATEPVAEAGAGSAPAMFLGRDGAGRPVVAVHLSADAETPAGGGVDPDDAGTGTGAARWRGLREVGPALSAGELDAVLTAVGLANWHTTHGFCARCGSPTDVTHAGWVRHCPACGREHYPRTDPAVIMAVTDEQDRLLLARQPSWPVGRRSVLAGFVEPGERPEDAVAREVAEEVGVVVESAEYVDAQPWPFPASLMLGYRARARGVEPALVDGEIAEAGWYTRAEVTEQVASGALGLPGRLSIARRLIEDWYGAPIAESAG